ncbi:MAG TPA: hypothetical protein VEC99_12920, partial [Clostridia bacterium]|nr:hypothetical protein [Clostridia bacterium]
TALTGCAPPAWERMDAPDITGKSAIAAVDGFVATNGWNMNISPFALFRPGGGQQGRLRGLPWSELAESSYPALTSKGILYVALSSSGNRVTGVAYNPNTNRFPKIVAGFKPLADHWYVWTLLAEDPATRPKLTQRYEGQN